MSGTGWKTSARRPAAPGRRGPPTYHEAAFRSLVEPAIAANL
jgi:hypothetical protein